MHRPSAMADGGAGTADELQMAVEEAVAWVAALGARGKAGSVLSARCQQLQELQARLSGRRRCIARTLVGASPNMRARARARALTYGSLRTRRSDARRRRNTIWARARLASATSAPGLGSPLPHLHRERPRRHGPSSCRAGAVGPGGCRRTRPSSSRRWKRSCGARRRSSRRSPSRQAAAPRPPMKPSLPAARLPALADECRACRSSHPKRSGYAARS